MPFSPLLQARYVTGALWLADGGTTVAKGAVGEQTPKSLRKESQGKLRLDHSRDGLENKETQTVKSWKFSF